MAQVLAEDERTQRTANALELERDGVADGVEDTVDGVIIEEMDVVEDEAVAGPSSDNRPQRKVKNTSIYQFEFSSDDEGDTTNLDPQEEEPVVQKPQEDEEEEVFVPPVKKRGRPKKSNTTTTLRKSSRKRNPSKN